MEDRLKMLKATAMNMERKPGLRSNDTSKLEVESQRMENRLKVLKAVMAAEKARRDTEGGIRWKSGSGSTTAAPRKLNIKNSGKPIRVKVLTDRESKIKSNTSSSNYATCGQCDKTNASLMCIECAEKYCQVCFVKFHQKGALAKHHVKPYLSKTTRQESQENVESSLQQKSKTISTTISKSPSSRQIQDTLASTRDKTKPSLLDGTYDEAASAASFQQAIAEWRNGNVSSKSRDMCSKGENTQSIQNLGANTASSASTNTNSTLSSKGGKQVEVTFSSDTGVSYFERILTRKNRCDPSLFKKMSTKVPGPMARSSSPATWCKDTKHDASEQSEMEPTVTQYNVFYSVDNDPYGQYHSMVEEYDDYIMYRPLSSVQIEEIGVTNCLNSVKSTGTAPDVTSTKVKNMPQDAHGDKRQESTLKEPSKEKQNKATSSKNTKYNKGTYRTRDPKRLGTQESSLGSTLPTAQTHISEMSVPDVKASVNNAWTECGLGGQRQSDRRPNSASKLSQFFLQGVQNPLSESAEEDDQGGQADSALSVDAQLQFVTSIWLPGDSIAPDNYSPTPSITDNTSDKNCPYESELKSIQISLDPSPAIATQSLSRSPDLELMLGSEELTLEQSEWDQEDNETLEDLAWELASTVESEGRLSRCGGELDSIDKRRSSMEDLTTGLVDDNCDVEIGNVDLERVVSEFELYQQQLLNEEM